MKKIAVIVMLFAIVSAKASAGDSAFDHGARYWEKVGGGIVQCQLCPRRCTIANGQRGVCTARSNRDGTLYTLAYGNPVSLNVDPIEKKPFFHVVPGSSAFSLAVAGCNMRCLFCQNWQISQAKPDEAVVPYFSPEDIVEQAVKSQAGFIAFTYTEPTIFYEYMLDIAKAAKKRGIRNVIHTCGYVNEAPLKELLPYIDAVNVDLKGFDEGFYKKMTAFASLQSVLATITRVKQAGVWLELTCLIIPGQNDDSKMVRRMCAWIRNTLGADVPVHFARFMPAFQLNNLPPTPIEKLEECCRIADEEGLHYVYLGNVPGHQGENTFCPNCKKMIIARTGYRIDRVDIKDGKCVYCGYTIAGIWK
jgi:pyruvate formate lyase activating enzyme